MIKGFQDLVVWQKAHKLALEIYNLTNLFPRHAQFGLASELRRAAYSIPSNLTEDVRQRNYFSFRLSPMDRRIPPK